MNHTVIECISAKQATDLDPSWAVFYEETCEIIKGDMVVVLRKTEGKVFSFIIKSPTGVATISRIERNVYGGIMVSASAVGAHLTRLRKVVAPFARIVRHGHGPGYYRVVGRMKWVQATGRNHCPFCKQPLPEGDINVRS